MLGPSTIEAQKIKLEYEVWGRSETCVKKEVCNAKPEPNTNNHTPI